MSLTVCWLQAFEYRVPTAAHERRGGEGGKGAVSWLQLGEELVALAATCRFRAAVVTPDRASRQSRHWHGVPVTVPVRAREGSSSRHGGLGRLSTTKSGLAGPSKEEGIVQRLRMWITLVILQTISDE